VGGLLGAAVTSAGKRDAQTGEWGPSAGPLYWALFGTAVIVGAAIPTYRWVVLLLTPFVQLAVSFVALCIIAVAPNYEANRGRRLQSLGWITLGTVLGTIVGAGIMFLWFVLSKR
jgi:hypothetical protein